MMPGALAFILAIVPSLGVEEAGRRCGNDDSGTCADDASALLSTRPVPSFAIVSTVEAAHPEQATERNGKRKKLTIEQNLDVLFSRLQSKLPQHSKVPPSKDDAHICHKHAYDVFDVAVGQLALRGELDRLELEVFRHRFASAMRDDCKSMDSEEAWLEAAGRELQRQKPVMTKALAASLNGARLGFKAKMQEWLLHESLATFQHRLGYLPVPNDQQSVLKRGRRSEESAMELPRNFRAEEKWPICTEAILRIHNQGHCGSCWAFGGLAAIDSRMCVASDGAWHAPKDTLSRLQVTSCAPGMHFPGSDGCQGGWPHWPMEMMAQRGVVSSTCLPYYISGEGTEHFEHQDEAPPCETHCQGGYSVSMRQDAFWASGIQNYDWLVRVHGDSAKIETMKVAIYAEGPVSFAFYANSAFMGYVGGVFSVCTGHDRANHAVYAFGWGTSVDPDGKDPVEFIEASNSWGGHWGAEGHFRIHPRCVTDVTIPGTIDGNPVNHSVGDVDSSVPRDPVNEYWPWAKPDECPFEDGCVTDLERDGDYVSNELCVSKALNGKRIRVAEFETELHYDVLFVNGQPFSGKEGAGLDLSSLNGMLVGELGIRFESDFSVEAPGWKLCVE